MRWSSRINQSCIDLGVMSAFVTISARLPVIQTGGFVQRSTIHNPSRSVRCSGGRIQMLFGLGRRVGGIGKGRGKPEERKGPNPYRSLGVSEDATYEEVEEAVKRLEIKFADEPKKKMMLEVYKDRIFEDRLRRRVAGEYTPKVKVSPYEKPVVKKKLFVLPRWLKDLVQFPSREYMQKTTLIMMIFVVLGFATPTLAGSCMAMAFIASMGFLYNRGLPDVVRDDYGNPGEVRPVKHKIVLITVLISLATAGVFFGLGQLYMLYLPLPGWCSPDSFVNFTVVFGLWFSAVFFRTQDPNNLY